MYLPRHPRASAPRLWDADVLSVRTPTAFGKAIRVGTRYRGERPSRCNHSAIAVRGRHLADRLRRMRLVLPLPYVHAKEIEPLKIYVVEALRRVTVTPWPVWRREHEHFVVHRHEDLNALDRACVAEQAACYMGRHYGWPKIAAHAVDFWFGRLLGRDVFLARRLARMDKYPICSWLVAWAYYRGADYTFGVPPRVADPDHILDRAESKAKPDGPWSTVTSKGIFTGTC